MRWVAMSRASPEAVWEKLKNRETEPNLIMQRG